MSTPPDGFIGPDQVQRELNLLERVKSAFGVDDDYLAASLANQLRLGQIEQRETELLEQIANRNISVDVGDLNLSETVLVSGINEALNELLIGAQVVWPGAGDVFAFPSAPRASNRIRANLVTGALNLADIADTSVKPNLGSIGADRALSANLWADADLEIFTFDENDVNTGHFTHDQLTFTRLSGISMARVEVQTDQTFTMRAQMSTGLVPPLGTDAFAGMQRRQAIQDTTDTLTPVNFAPPNIADSLGLDPSITKTVIEDHGVDQLLTKNVGQAIFIVENADAANDADVQVRERDIDGEEWVADNDIHGTTEDDPSVNAAATVTIPAGTTDLLETGITTRWKQFRIESTTDGQPAEVRVQYGGFTPSMR